MRLYIYTLKASKIFANNKTSCKTVVLHTTINFYFSTTYKTLQAILRLVINELTTLFNQKQKALALCQRSIKRYDYTLK